MLGLVTRKLRLQHLDCLCHERHEPASAALAALARDRPQGILKPHVLAPHRLDFATPRGRPEAELHDACGRRVLAA